MAKDRPGHFNEDMSGLAAFRAAMKPQEGQFMRGASYIMNSPKDMSDKPARSPNRAIPSKEVAKALLDRNASGQFVSRSDRPDVKEDDDDVRSS
jgi:hypothetical protein